MPYNCSGLREYPIDSIDRVEHLEWVLENRLNVTAEFSPIVTP